MKKILVCLFLSAASAASSAHAHNPHRHHNYHNYNNYPNHNIWAPIVAGAVVGAILNRPGVVYSQPVPVQPYFPSAVVPQVNYGAYHNYGTYYNYTPSCRYAEARDYYGNVTSYLKCN